MNSSSKMSCCLICSILSSLSNVNCCSKHLSLLNRTRSSGLPTQIVYMMPPTVNEWSKLDCSCRSRYSKSKRHHHRSRSSSSSSSSKSRRPRKKRSVAIQSTDAIENNDVEHRSRQEEHTTFHMEVRERSSTNRQRRSNQFRTPLSPLFPSYSLMNTNMNSNKLVPYNMRSSTPIAIRTNETKSNDHVESTVQCQTDEQPPLPSSPVYSPRIMYSQMIHVKDEAEEVLPDVPQKTLSMAQATEQMMAQTVIQQPKIILQRVSLEVWNDKKQSSV